MQYYMPVKVYEESDCVKSHKEVFAAAGEKALLVTGRHSAKANGSLEDVTSVLDEAGIGYVIYDEVEENPSIETVMKARDLGMAEGADYVVGIGGGSPMDAAKAIAVMMAHPEEGADYLYDAEKAKEDADPLSGGTAVHLPLILIPTTCGTGSEVTGVSVLTIHKKKTKSSIPHKVFAEVALIDGKYLAAAPAAIIRNTAVDALGHLWESYCNSGATAYSRMCAEAGLKAWRRIKGILLELEKRPLTNEESLQLMRASALAGMAIAQTGTSIPHALSYGLTYDLQMPHGMAVGMFEAGYLREIPKEERDTVLQLAGFADLAEWEEFYTIVCGSVVIPEEVLERGVFMVAASPARMAKAPFECNEEVLRRIAMRS